jgi:hypothetical protein
MLEGGRRELMTTSPSSMRQLSRKYGSLNISQTYEPPRQVTGIIYFYVQMPPRQ